MRITLDYDITPQMWMDYWVTLVEGKQSNYWAEWLSFYVKDAKRKSGWREVSYLDGTASGAIPGMYAEQWKVQVRLFAHDIGPKGCAGLVRRYQITPESFQQAATLNPELFLRFVHSERDSNFDAIDAERILQLACFGREVFG